ncbi:MAG: ComF family protein [Candidatus Electronema sp. V4]|uniref:ComF family protein n=1 Tax=Candidatus Electronema sp. V4 TaxID=3454756 RepID=UPI0040558F0D
MRLLLEALYDLLFPPRCLGCEEQILSSRPPLFCAGCRAKIASFPPSCAAQDDFPFTAFSLCIYQEPVSSLLVRLKFSRDLSGLSSIAALACAAERLPPEPDLILPVPLHRSRLRWRGFNQAVLLAKTCFPFWKDRIRVDLLQRHKKTVPQLGLSGAERRSNLAGAFRVLRPQEISGRRILLVDDVFTTGSTLRECADVLRAAGAAEIAAFTVARTAD